MPESAICQIKKQKKSAFYKKKCFLPLLAIEFEGFCRYSNNCSYLRLQT
jgi:hypothetical protein